MADEHLTRTSQESRAAHQALLDYAAMGAGGKRRSIRALAEQYRGRSASDSLALRPPTTSTKTLFGWSKKYEWDQRITLYDAAQAAIEQAEREAALAERRAAWVARHMEADEVLARLADHGRSSLAPFIERNEHGEMIGIDVSDDTPLHLIKEATVTKRSIGELVTETTIKIKVYDAHAALVKLGEHHKLFGKADDGILKYVDLSKLDADQLARIANGDNPIDVLINKPDPTPGAS